MFTFLSSVVFVVAAVVVVDADMSKIKKCGMCMKKCALTTCNNDMNSCAFPPLELDSERVLARVSGDLVKVNYTVTHFAFFKDKYLDDTAGVAPLSTYIDSGVPGLTEDLFPAIFPFLDDGDQGHERLTPEKLEHLTAICREACGNRTYYYSGWGFSETNPLQWPGICQTGMMQSPIDLPDPNTVTQVNTDLNFDNYLRIVSDYRLENDGYTIRVKFPDSIVQSTYMFLDGERYHPEEMYFHLPSEHTINGRRTAMEMHIEHFNDNDEHAVISWLFDVDPTNTATGDFDMASVALAIMNTKTFWPGVVDDGTATRPALSFNLHGLDLDYYRYNGSDAHPSCDEGVKWVIRKDVDVIPRVVYQYFQNVRRCDMMVINGTETATIDVDIFGNIRAIQPRNGRGVELITHNSP